MKYIRTKDGIFENKPLEKHLGKRKGNGFEIVFKEQDIIKQADTIEELIMPGDLVRYDFLYMSWIEKDRGDKVRGIDMHLIPRKSVCDLWIPTGDDPECHPNFKLVATKNCDEKELRLI